MIKTNIVLRSGLTLTRDGLADYSSSEGEDENRAFAQNVAAAGIANVFMSTRKASHSQWLNGRGVTATPPMKAAGPMSGIREKPPFLLVLVMSMRMGEMMT